MDHQVYLEEPVKFCIAQRSYRAGEDSVTPRFAWRRHQDVEHVALEKSR